VLGLLFSHCSKKKEEVGTGTVATTSGKSKTQQSQYPHSGMFETEDNHRYQYAAEINVERQDDISTLGDPMFGLMINAPSADRDERTASVAADYDYARQFLGGTTMLTARDRVHSTESDFLSSAHTESFSKLSALPEDNPNRIFDDDVSFEEQYGPTDGKEEQEGVEKIRVIVPPGKLGMVIDTPGGGCPVVHNIKPESILVDRIQVGDQLVSVDQEDVTQMTAVQVSKLISLRSNQTRVLVFVRHRERAFSADEDYVLDEGHC
jgi:C-terminal processing protease CtpA/Prc